MTPASGKVLRLLQEGCVIILDVGVNPLEGGCQIFSFQAFWIQICRNLTNVYRFGSFFDGSNPTRSLIFEDHY
jgi:hypothetical protein